MNTNILSPIETKFLSKQDITPENSKIPYLLVDSFPHLGMITALRFLEWVQENPEGVISLPTGKTPEYFIKWTNFLLENRDNEKGGKILDEYGLKHSRKPDLKRLHFITGFHV